ncbi:MAG: sugar 3,4-ketoisomerase [Parasutterella sp.]|uniref:sugar 3,4-ketoisomerase n=1 Tax=Parasutterella sp. TaxID=2049037 RepID=UPI003996B4CE
MYKVISFEEHRDRRGALVALESTREVPFEIKRVYFIYDTDPNYERGFHAHFNLKQLLICVSGSVDIHVSEGPEQRDVINLNEPSKGLLIEGVVWREMKNWKPGTVLLVFASEFYNREDYIFDFEEFISLAKKLNT